MSEPDTCDRCYSCEERPIRKSGELVSRLEGMADRRLYCEECAAACERGEWEIDPDEEAA